MSTGRSLFILTLLACLCSPALAQRKPRNLLTGPLSEDKLAPLILPRKNYKPYPPASDRAAWAAIPEALRQELIANGEAALKTPYPATTATAFLRFVRDGDRDEYQQQSFGRRRILGDLVLAECAEGKGRFLDHITDGIWMICEESYWGVSAHVGVQKAGSGLPDVTEPTVDLFAAETGMLLSWTTYLLGDRLDKVSPLIRKRIDVEVERRILTPCFERQFGWMGLNHQGMLNNWTPWICSNWLACNLLIEKDEARRIKATHKIMRCVDEFMNSYGDDGGCDEGPGYWGHAGGSLFDCLELLRGASDGKINIYPNPLVREIALYLPRAHIAGDWYVNFADASAKSAPYGDLVYRFGSRVEDAKMMSFGAYLVDEARKNPPERRGFSFGRSVAAVFNAAELARTRPAAPLLRDAWLPDIQVMFARSKADTTDGLYIAAQGGHNAESHNHNDVGNFVVFSGGKPLLIDVGAPTYTSKTFSSRRYDIWVMRSEFHNCPTINGVVQSAGRKFAAHDVGYRVDDQATVLSMDIAGAYPEPAGVKSWKRTMSLNRGEKPSIEIVDAYQLTAPGKSIDLNLITPCTPTLTAPGMLKLSGGESFASGTIEFDPKSLEAKLEPIEVKDGRLERVWGKTLHRIVLRQTAPPDKGELRVTVR